RWNLIPKNVNRLFYIIVMSVDQAYTRRGLGKVLLDFGMDRVSKYGARGIFSEATAMMSQGMFKKLGYNVLKEIRHADYKDKQGRRIFNCPDGTDRAQLVFRYI
ncbi:hypothetical protein PMAYCL1PPCAC_22332, partial [Pristionchus mayeri]